MAENSKRTPDYEYSKVDYQCILVFTDGEYPLENRWESASRAMNPDRGTMAGSGRFPRAHRATRYAPELTITTDHDTADYIATRSAKQAIKAVKFIRQRPGDAPITDVYESWLPSFPDVEAGDDPTQCELVGNFLSMKLDTQGKNRAKSF